jgi:hypothetical protein
MAFIRFLKILAHALAIGLFSTVLFTGTILLAVSTNVTNRDVVKSWPVDSGAYQNLTPNLLELVEQGDENGQEEDLRTIIEAGGLNIDGVEQVITTEFSPTYWQEKFEGVIDPTYDWLSGQGELAFTVSLADKEDSFVSAIEGELGRQFTAFPVCQVSDIPREFDALKADCLPPGISATQAARIFGDELQGEDSLFADATFTSADLDLSQDVKENAPRIFGHLSNLGWYVLGSLLLLGAIIILTDKNPLRGMRRVGQSLFSAGILTWIGFFLTQRFGTSQITVEGDAVQERVARDVLVPLMKEALGDVAGTGLWISLSIIITGIVIWLSAYFWHKVHHHPDQSANRPPSQPREPQLPEPVDPNSPA